MARAACSHPTPCLVRTSCSCCTDYTLRPSAQTARHAHLHTQRLAGSGTCQGKLDSSNAHDSLLAARDAESETDNIMEIKVPFWIDAEDIFVKISPNSIYVNVRNELDLRRACWQNM